MRPIRGSADSSSFGVVVFCRRRLREQLKNGRLRYFGDVSLSL